MSSIILSHVMVMLTSLCPAFQASVLNFVTDRASRSGRQHLYGKLKQKPEALQPHDGLTMVHVLQAHDSIARLAVRYSTSKQEIMRLNRLPSEFALHGKASILVPQPPDAVKKSM